MLYILGIVILIILVILVISIPILSCKKVTGIEKTKLISKLLCQFCVVFVVQDLIYAILTESFHNGITKKKEHLFGLFYNKPLENEWFWLILIVSLTFYFSQVCKLTYKTIRDSQNKDSIEKLK